MNEDLGTFLLASAADAWRHYQNEVHPVMQALHSLAHPLASTLESYLRRDLFQMMIADQVPEEVRDVPLFFHLDNTETERSLLVRRGPHHAKYGDFVVDIKNGFYVATYTVPPRFNEDVRTSA